MATEAIVAVEDAIRAVPSVWRRGLLRNAMQATEDLELSRTFEYESALQALMVAFYHNPDALQTLERSMTRRWNEYPINGPAYDEVVVGGGLHGCIYAMNRPGKVLVLTERRAGGVFGESSRPMFWLNSRNRPNGEAQLPRQAGALNFIPGGIIQPSMLSADEYQSQHALGMTIRMNLVLSTNITVGENRQVTYVYRRYDGKYIVEYVGPLGSGQIAVNRVTFATGLGDERRIPCSVDYGGGVKTFMEFMRSASANPFPLRGIRKAAVIGAGDSACVAVEYLLGQGPSPAMSTAALDYVESIDWIGQGYQTRQEVEECFRSRYKGIGRYMRDERRDDQYYRIEPRKGRAKTIGKDAKSQYYVEVPGRRLSGYDLVIVCAGFKRIDVPLARLIDAERELVVSDGEYVGRRVSGENIHIVGPAAELPLTPNETRRAPVLREIEENAVAAFRYAPKTAQLAIST
jgi:hypothetical protein